MTYPYNQPYPAPALQQYPAQYAPPAPRYPTYAPQAYQPQYQPYYPQYQPSPVEQMQAAMPPPAPQPVQPAQQAPPVPTIEDRIAALEQEFRQLKEALGGE